jgi:hypothetical protein
MFSNYSFNLSSIQSPALFKKNSTVFSGFVAFPEHVEIYAHFPVPVVSSAAAYAIGTDGLSN